MAFQPTGSPATAPTTGRKPQRQQRPAAVRGGRKVCQPNPRARACLSTLFTTAALCALLVLCQTPPGGAQYSRRQVLVAPPQLAPQLQPQPPPAGLVVAPGSAPLLTKRVDRVVLPDDSAPPPANGSLDWARTSYVIDNKLYVEAAATRCWASTISDEPESLEPSFVVVRPESEVRVNATAPAELVRRLANFQPELPTRLFVHGFTQSYPDTDWLRKTRALFELNNQLHDQNLIIMDWGVASRGSYTQVAARAGLMGSFLANFLMKLTDELGAERMSLHLVCHSLGAHICGFAGKRLQRPAKLGRITALDPAGPCFGKFLGNSDSDRLAARDAFEVDVYHYDDSFLGLAGQIGQFDVYVNGGSSQPGAKDNWNTMLQALLTVVFRRNRVLSESHTRSTELATSQLAGVACQEVAYECRDWPAFLAGECGHCDPANSQCFFMGLAHQYQAQNVRDRLRTTNEPRRLYVATSARDPFCLQHYQILVRLEPNTELALQAKRYAWRLHLELADLAGNRLNVTLTNQALPLTFSYLLLSELAPLKFRAGALEARQVDGARVPLAPAADPRAGRLAKSTPAAQLTSVDINFLSHVDPLARQSLSSRLCPLADANSVRDSTPADERLALAECN